MLAKLPILVLEQICNAISYIDFWNLKKSSRGNSFLTAKLDEIYIDDPLICPFCVLEKPFNAIQKQDEDFIERENNFMNNLLNKPTGNKNWRTFQTEEEKWIIEWAYTSLSVHEITVNSALCPNFCQNLFRCLQSQFCPPNSIVYEIQEMFRPEKIQVFRNGSLFQQHLSKHLTFNKFSNFSFDYCIQLISNQVCDMTEFREIIQLLVARKYIHVEKFKSRAEFSPNRKIHAEVKELYMIAVEILKELEFSFHPTKENFQQRKFFEVLSLLLSNIQYK